MKFERSHLHIDGRNVGVDVATLTRHGAGHGKEATPRLRFDKVVVRVTAQLQAALGPRVPRGVTVLFTLTAPIRQAAKTTAAIEAKALALLARAAADGHTSFTRHGNRIQLQVVTHGLARAPKVIGFVHNPGTAPTLLFNITRELLDLAAATTRRRANTRGLVIMTARHSACLDACRHIYAQLLPATNARKILMVFSDGRAELLTH